MTFVWVKLMKGKLKTQFKRGCAHTKKINLKPGPRHKVNVLCLGASLIKSVKHTDRLPRVNMGPSRISNKTFSYICPPG